MLSVSAPRVRMWPHVNDHALTCTRVCLAWVAFRQNKIRQFKIYTVLGLNCQIFPLPIFCDLRHLGQTLHCCFITTQPSTQPYMLWQNCLYCSVRYLTTTYMYGNRNIELAVTQVHHQQRKLYLIMYYCFHNSVHTTSTEWFQQKRSTPLWHIWWLARSTRIPVTCTTK